MKQNKLMSRKHKKVCTTQSYIELFLILASTITGCISISDLTSLIGITRSAVGLKICAITAGIKKYKSVIRKKKKKHYKIVLPVKFLISFISFISRTLINSVISQDEFVLINHVLK